MDTERFASPPPHWPWKANLAWIGYAFVVMFAGWFFLYKNGKQQEFFILALFCTTIAVANFHSLNARIHGQLVEKNAIRQLEKIDKNKITKNKPLPGRGDIDLIFKGRNKTFNIEIKSVQDYHKVTKKHMRQVLDASEYLHSQPVIWLPKAPQRRVVQRGEVTIFCGTARQLHSHLN
jgi:Holliday junction resolvase-like predicted endonuclease